MSIVNINSNNQQIIKTAAATIRVVEPNIVENLLYENIALDAPDLLEIKRINKLLTKGKKYGVIVDPGLSATVTKDGRALSASEEFQQQTLAVALLRRTLHHNMIFNFYTRLNKPKTKIQLFSAREDAITWLRGQLK